MNMELKSETKNVEYIKAYLLSEKKRATQIMERTWSSDTAKLDVIIIICNRIGVFSKIVEMLRGIIDHEDFCDLLKLLESITNILKEEV